MAIYKRKFNDTYNNNPNKLINLGKELLNYGELVIKIETNNRDLNNNNNKNTLTIPRFRCTIQTPRAEFGTKKILDRTPHDQGVQETCRARIC